MTTATELQLMAERGRDLMQRISERIVRPLTTTLLVLTAGREISAARKRKLRQRGAEVRFSHRTPTGKCRYRWLPAGPTWVP